MIDTEAHPQSGNKRLNAQLYTVHLVHTRSSQGSGIITEEGAERFEEPFMVDNTGKACLLG